MIENDSSISKFLNNCLSNMSEQTQKTYRYNLKRFCRWADSEGLNICNISEKEIKNYVIYLTSKNITSFRQQINNVVRFMKFNTGKDFDIKVIVDQINVINKKQVNLPSVENVKELIEKAIERAEKDNNLRDEMLLSIFFYTGLRVSEVGNLKKTDLKESNIGPYLNVNVYKKVDRYSQSIRRIPLEPKFAEFIKQYITIRSDSNSAMFLSKNGQRLSIRGIQDILKKYKVNGNLIRRSFITGLLKKGINASEIASLMGHTSPEMVFRYLNSNRNHEDTAFKTLSELYNKDK